MKSFKRITLFTSLFFAIFSSFAHANSLKICSTTPELGNLAKTIGGDQVEVTVFAKGQEDPHALLAKPSDILKLSKADALILSGLGLEAGWAPALINRARNPLVRPGAIGYIDASKAVNVIKPVNNSVITRAMGDVHPEGNPHYMLDPINGYKVANYLTKYLSQMKPLMKDTFQKNLKAFEKEWGKRAFGEELSNLFPIEKLVKLTEIGKLDYFLEKAKKKQLLKGWFGNMATIKGSHLIADHDQWQYFAKRFNLNIDKAIEPKPGVPPGSRHLKHLIEWMKAHKVKGVLASSYFSPRHLNFIKKNSGAEILTMAHQVGSRPKADTYLNMLDHNIRLVCECCKKKMKRLD